MELKDLKSSLDKLDTTINLLLNLNDTTIKNLHEHYAKLKADAEATKQVLTNAHVGFDEKELYRQSVSTINSAISSSQYSRITSSVNDATKAFEKFAHFKYWYQWWLLVICGGSGLVLGLLIAWFMMYTSTQDTVIKYQKTVQYAETFTDYVNSSCSMKQGYAKFTNHDPVDCKTNQKDRWKSPNEYFQDLK